MTQASLPDPKTKLQLGNFPSPIQYLDRLSRELDRKIYLKRDDYSGIECSGNKIRKLEYALAQAMSLGADSIVTTGAIQSNHCRATAAACTRLGLDCHLVLSGQSSGLTEGNPFYAKVLGANIHLVETSQDREAKMSEVRSSLIRQGKNPYLIPIGASNSIGSQGYRQCYREILQQEANLGLEFDLICLAVGSGGTLAGLAYENYVQAGHKQIYGFCVSDTKQYFRLTIDSILLEMAQAEELDPQSLNIAYQLNDQYVGPGYAQTTQSELKKLVKIARKTGVIFDPCYTGKAILGLVQELKLGRMPETDKILFIHTGGLFGWTENNRLLALN